MLVLVDIFQMLKDNFIALMIVDRARDEKENSVGCNTICQHIQIES